MGPAPAHPTTNFGRPIQALWVPKQGHTWTQVGPLALGAPGASCGQLRSSNWQGARPRGHRQVSTPAQDGKGSHVCFPGAGRWEDGVERGGTYLGHITAQPDHKSVNKEWARSPTGLENRYPGLARDETRVTNPLQPGKERAADTHTCTPRAGASYSPAAVTHQGLVVGQEPTLTGSECRPEPGPSRVIQGGPVPQTTQLQHSRGWEKRG